MGVFHFPETRAKRPAVLKPRQVEIEREPEEVIGLIQGKEPQSKEEFYVAGGLDLAGWGYRYQVPIGVPGTAGSQKLDFLVFTAPRPTPLSVKSSRYHGTLQRTKDEINVSRLPQISHGRWAPLEEIWDYEATSTQHAFETLMQMFGRGPGA